MFVYRRDLYVPAADLWIDPSRPRERAFVSHAHGDHIGRHSEIWATPATARIMQHRLGALNVHPVEYGREYEPAPGVRMRVHPAGHILGAAQLEVRLRGQRLVYTGDFRLKPSLTTPAGVVVPCDMLIMECTYGRPHYRFPPREEVVPRLVEDLRQLLAEGRTPVILAYTLGRSQELLALLEPHGLRIALAPPIHAMARLYEEMGVPLGAYEYARPGGTDGCVLFLPPRGQRSRLLRSATNPVRIAVTGWAMDGEQGAPYPADRSYPVSDHADFDELRQYVRESRPREVYTVHGFPDFQRFLREEGFAAFPVQTRVALR